jgi:hypothetical protein
MSDATYWAALMGPWEGSRADNGDIARPAIVAIKTAGRSHYTTGLGWPA